MFSRAGRQSECGSYASKPQTICIRFAIARYGLALWSALSGLGRLRDCQRRPLRSASQSSVGIDFVRAMAALCVVVSHLRGLTLIDFGSLPGEQRTIFATGFYAITRLGHEAVIVFFVLSGYLVGGGALEKVLEGTFNARSYLIDRITRIYVPLAPAVLFTCYVIYLHEHSWPGHSQILVNLAALNGIFAPTLRYDSALWSIAYETLFYWIFLTSVLTLHRDYRGISLVVSLCAGVILIMAFSVFDFRLLFIWCLGIGAFQIREKLGRLGYFWFGVTLFFSGLILYQMQSGTKAFDTGITGGAAQSEILLATGFALALPAIDRFALGAKMRWFASFTAFLAGISYSLYLTHLPLIGLFELADDQRHQLDTMSLAWLAAKFAAIILFAWLFSAIFERGGFVLRRRLKLRFVPTPKVAAA